MNEREDPEQALRVRLSRLADAAPSPTTAAVLLRLRRRAWRRSLAAAALLLAGGLLTALLLGRQATPTQPTTLAQLPAPAIRPWPASASPGERRQALAALLGPDAAHLSGTIAKEADGRLAVSLASDGGPIPAQLVASLQHALADFGSARLVLDHGELVCALYAPRPEHPAPTVPGSG